MEYRKSGRAGPWRSASAPLAGIETIPASMYPLNTRPYSCMPPISRTARGRTVATRRVCNPAVISTRQSPTVVKTRPSPTRARHRGGDWLGGAVYVHGSRDFPALTGHDRPRLRSGLALTEPNQVAGRVAERAVPHAIRLINRLLQHLATSGPDVLEGRIAILGAEDDAAQLTLGEHLLHDLAVGRGCVGVGEWRLEDDVDVRLALGPDRGPAHALVFDVAAHLQPEKIPVEGECLVVVVDGDEAVTKFQVHAITLRAVRPRSLLHFCSVLSSP